MSEIITVRVPGIQGPPGDVGPVGPPSETALLLSPLASDAFLASAAGTAFPLGVTVHQVTTGVGGYPAGGTLVTYRTANSRVHQTLYEAESDVVRYRAWVNGTATWTAWNRSQRLLYASDTFLPATPGTAFPDGQTVHSVTSGAGYPVGGTLVTIRTANTRVHQALYEAESDNTLRRSWDNAAGVWTAWAPTYVQDANAITAAMVLTDVPLGRTVTPVTTVGGWPHSGTLITVRGDNVKGHQLLWKLSTAEFQIRAWDGAAWTAWELLQRRLFPANGFAHTDGPSAYPDGQTVMQVTGAANWIATPGIGGSVITVKAGANNRTHQWHFESTGTTVRFRAGLNGTDWSAWGSIGGFGAHNHDDAYAAIDHVHDGAGHEHDADYAPLGGATTLATRPAASASLAGALWLVTDENGGQLYFCNGTSWVKTGPPLGDAASERVLVRKTADEIVNNSTALQNDDHLLFALAAEEEWAFRMVLFVEGGPSGATADLRAALTVPAGATFIAALVGPGISTSSGGAASSSNKVMTASGAAVTCGLFDSTAVMVLIEGTVDVGATPGDLQLQWAQSVITATDVIVKAGSFLEARRIA